MPPQSSPPRSGSTALPRTVASRQEALLIGAGPLTAAGALLALTVITLRRRGR